MGIRDIDVNDYIIRPPRFRSPSPAASLAARPREVTSPTPDPPSYVTDSYSASYVLRNFLPDLDSSLLHLDEFVDVLDESRTAPKDPSKPRPSARWPGIVANNGRWSRGSMDQPGKRPSSRDNSRTTSAREAQQMPRSAHGDLGRESSRRFSGPEVTHEDMELRGSSSKAGYSRSPSLSYDQGRSSSINQQAYSSRPRSSDQYVSPTSHHRYGASPPRDGSVYGSVAYHESPEFRNHRHKRKSEQDFEDPESIRHRRIALVDRCKAEDEILFRNPNDVEAYNRRQALVSQLKAEDESAIGGRRSGSYQERPQRRQRVEEWDAEQSWKGEDVYPQMRKMPLPNIEERYARSTSTIEEQQPRTESYHFAMEHLPMPMPPMLPMPPMPMPPMPLPPMPMPPMPMMPMMPMPPSAGLLQDPYLRPFGGGPKQFKRDKGNASRQQQVSEHKARPSRYFLAQTSLQIMEMVKREGAWALSNHDLRETISSIFASSKVIIIFQDDESSDKLLGYAHMEGDIGTGLRPVWVSDPARPYFPITLKQSVQVQAPEVRRIIEGCLETGKPEEGFQEISGEGAVQLLDMMKSEGQHVGQAPRASANLSNGGTTGARKVADYTSGNGMGTRASATGSHIRAQYQAPKAEAARAANDTEDG